MGRTIVQTTFRRDLWTWMRPLYSRKPSLRKRFINKLNRDRVVPIMSASVSCVIGEISVSGMPGWPNSAISNKIRARRFSLVWNSWSTKSARTRILRADRKAMKTLASSCS